MKIAIFGSTSQIAIDLLNYFEDYSGYTFFLFGRDRNALFDIASKLNIDASKTFPYDCFPESGEFDVIINFIGITSSNRNRKSKESIFYVSKYYDELVLSYLKKNPRTKYIFLSSGAALNYQKVKENVIYEKNFSDLNFNLLKDSDVYTFTKGHIEEKHRILKDFNIIDLRIFSYFSHTLNSKNRFLMTEIVDCLCRNKIFKTSSQNIYRDYISPKDLGNIIKIIIDDVNKNYSFECYSRLHLSKFKLLESLKDEFHLRYEIDKSLNFQLNDKLKINYYPMSHDLQNYGYKPEMTSLETLVHECEIYFQKHKRQI